MTNREHLACASTSVDAMLADVKEKNQMIDAGELHLRPSREDDLGECQTILENMQTELARLDYLL